MTYNWSLWAKRHKYRRRDESKSPAELKHSSLKWRFISFFPRLKQDSIFQGRDSQTGWPSGRAGEGLGGRGQQEANRAGNDAAWVFEFCSGSSHYLASFAAAPGSEAWSEPWLAHSAGQPAWVARLTGAASLQPSQCRAAAAVPLKAHSRSSAPRSEEKSEK